MPRLRCCCNSYRRITYCSWHCYDEGDPVAVAGGCLLLVVLLAVLPIAYWAWIVVPAIVQRLVAAALDVAVPLVKIGVQVVGGILIAATVVWVLLAVAHWILANRPVRPTASWHDGLMDLGTAAAAKKVHLGGAMSWYEALPEWAQGIVLGLGFVAPIALLMIAKWSLR